jgi:hypothetical protein
LYGKSIASSNNLAYKMRHCALTSHDQVNLKKIEYLTFILYWLFKRKNNTPQESIKYMKYLKILVMIHAKQVTKVAEVLKIKNRFRDINSFSEGDCRINLY